MAGLGILHLKYGSFVVESSLSTSKNSVSSSNPLHKNSKMEKAIAAEATLALEGYVGASFLTSPPGLHYPFKFGSFVVESSLSTSKNLALEGYAGASFLTSLPGLHYPFKFGSFVVESSLSTSKNLALKGYAGASFLTSPPSLHYPFKFGSFVVESSLSTSKNSVSSLSTSKNSVSSSNPLHKNSKMEKAITAEATSALERYAGASFFTSPPPTSLPLPAFLTKNAATWNNHNSTSAL